MPNQIGMNVMGILVVVASVVPLLFGTVLPVNQILASGLSTEGQVPLGLERNSTAKTNDPGIQPEDRFLINEPRAPPPLKILSQYAENKPTTLGNGRILEISGEVMNVSPSGEVFNAGNGEYVKLIVTLYDAYGQIVGSDYGLIDPYGQGIYPNQIYTYRAVIAAQDVSIPINEVRSFSLKPAWLLG